MFEYKEYGFVLNEHILNNYFVIRSQRNRNVNYTIANGKIIENSYICSSGACVRVTNSKGTYGFAATHKIDKAAIENAYIQANKNATIINKYTRDRNALNLIDSVECREKEKSINTVNLDEIKEYMFIIDAYIKKSQKYLNDYFIAFHNEIIEKKIKASYSNMIVSNLERSYLELVFQMESAEGKKVCLNKKISFKNSFDNSDSAYYIIKNKIDETLLGLNKKQNCIEVLEGEKDVVLSPEVTGVFIHEAIGHLVEGDMLANKSVFYNKFGEALADTNLTIIDYANEYCGEKTNIPVYYDDEAIKAEDVEIIKNGKLVGGLHNLLTANEYGIKPKGNSRGFTYMDEPLIRMRNTLMLPGKDKLNEMINLVDNGYYLVTSKGGKADKNGKFYIGISEAYEVVKGKIGRAVEDFYITGNSLQVLKNIDMIGDTIEWNSAGYCVKKQKIPVSMGGPSIKCRVMVSKR